MNPVIILYMLSLAAPFLGFIVYLLLVLVLLRKSQRNQRPESRPSRRIMVAYPAYLFLLMMLLAVNYFEFSNSFIGTLYTVPPLLLAHPIGFMALWVFIFLDLRRVRRGWELPAAT